MTANQKSALSILAILPLLLFFQNCAPGMQTINPSNTGTSTADSSGTPQQPNPAPQPGPTPEPAPAPTPLPGPSPSPNPGPNPSPTPAPQPTPSPTPDPSDAGRRILKVCPSGCTYTLPSQAVAGAQAQDIIEVAAGRYNDCFSLAKNGIKLRGVGGRAHLSGKACAGKGAIVISGSDTVIENFEFSNIAVPDRNGAGIRHQGLGLIVRNSFFHDSENGILSGRAGTPDPRDVILVENSRFEHLGGDAGHAHAVYFGAHSQVTVRNSVFLASRQQGHEFKSRAKASLIECSYLGNLDGQDSYTANFPDGGNVIVRNSVLEQGPATSNSGIVDYGSEMATQHAVNTLHFDQVAIINDLGRGTFFQIKNSTQFSVSNTTLVGAGTAYSLQMATENSVIRKADRNSAGFPAYPNFPTPAACTGAIGLLN